MASPLLGLVLSVTAAHAADFSHPQKIYVPASRIDRRFDYDSLNARAGAAPYGTTRQTGVSLPPPSAPPGSSGLVPPPPAIPVPITTQGPSIVPPPPPSPQLVAGPAGTLKAPSQTSAKGQTASHGSAAQARAKAQQLVKQGKLDDADLVLRAARRQYPKDALVTADLYNLSIQRARKFLAARDYESAAKASREALYLNAASLPANDLLNQTLRKTGINPLNAQERLRLADKLADQGRDTAALVEYRCALKLKPNPAAHVGLGNMELRSGQKSKAKEEYQLAIELDSNYAPAYRQLGLLKLSLNDVVGANSDLSRALIIDSNDKSAGKALIELWQKQVAKDPSSCNSHLGLARAYQLSGDLKEAQAEYREVVRIDPNHPNLPACRQSFKLALAKQEAGHSIDAAHTLEAHGNLADAHGKVVEALQLFPADTAFLMYQGHLLERLGQYQQAHDVYMTVLKEDPNNHDAAERIRALPSLLSSPPFYSGYLPALAPAGRPFQAGNSAGPGFAPSASLSGLAGLAGLAGSAGAGAAGLAGKLGPFTEQAPALTIPQASQAFPALAAQAAAQAAAQPPGSVGTLSNFLTQLRNQTIVQQKQDQAMERNAHAVLDQAFASPATQAAPPGASAGGPPAGSVADFIKSLNQGNSAAGSSSFNPPVVVMPPLPKSSAPPQTMPANNAGAVAFQGTSTQTLASATAQSLPAAALAGAPAMDPMTYQRLLFAEQQNRMLATQLQQTQQQLQQLQQGQLPQAAPPGGDVNALAPPSPAPGSGFAGPPPSMPQLAGPIPMQPVRLELEGISPTAKGVKLKVVLRNDQSIPLPLKSEMQAVIRSGNSPDTNAKAYFHDKQVSAHGSAHGTINVPTRNISPTADLFLPNLLPPTSAQRDVHLTASMPPASL